MQTSSPSLNHVDSIELSDPSKNPHESKIEAREDSTSEDDVYVDVFLMVLSALLMTTVPIQMYKPAFPTRTRTCPLIPFALGFWGSLEPWC